MITIHFGGILCCFEIWWDIVFQAQFNVPGSDQKQVAELLGLQQLFAKKEEEHEEVSKCSRDFLNLIPFCFKIDNRFYMLPLFNDMNKLYKEQY